MFVELQDKATRRRMREIHAQMTVVALNMIFEYDERDGKSIVADLHARSAKISRRQLDQLLHDDPVSLAARIAKVSPTELEREPFPARIAYYNAQIRPAFEKIALEDFEAQMKPAFEKLISQG